MKRPIVVISIGYIIGILMGLYFKISIVLIYFAIFIIYLIIKITYINKQKNRKVCNKLKLLSSKRYIRYIKLIITKKVIIVIVISSTISNFIVVKLNKKYDILYSNINNNVKIVGTICSNKKEKQFKNIYKIKVESVNNNEKYKNTYLILNISKEIKVQYGDKIEFTGDFISPTTRRNYKGFNYKEYLKTLNTYGTIKTKDVKVIKENSLSIIKIVSNNIFLKIKQRVEETYKETEGSLLLGIMLGYTDNINDDIKETFSDNSISHILAVSGMHISYIILGVSLLFNKFIGKRKTRLLVILTLIIYIFITGFSPSIIRAEIMAILLLMSYLLYRKSDIWTNISLSLLCILIYNPFLITNIGLILSYGGTIGIIVFQKNIYNLLQKINNTKYKSILGRKKINDKINKTQKVKEKLLEIISVIISAQIVLIPIIIISFNKVGLTVLLINILVSFIIGPIVILGFIQIISLLISIELGRFISYILSPIIKILLLISNLGNQMPLNKIIYLKTPEVYTIILYYIFIFYINYILKIYNLKNLSSFQKRIKNLIQVLKYKSRNNKRKIQCIIFIMIITFFIASIFPKNLKIYFIDVGQGDSTLIVTPLNKTILIDGGGSENSEFDVGEDILLPYLLDRKITKINYMIISHFDKDHSLGCMRIMENINVSNIIISEQFEENNIYKQVVSIAKKKKIRLIYVKAGDQLNIDGIKLTIIHPQKQLMTNNAINNNSIVCKLEYKSFSILFTGDIEKEAEDLILDKKINLKADILKIAHHRF